MIDLSLLEESPTQTGNYFVATYPPFSAWLPEWVAAARQHLAAEILKEQTKPFGLYVHLPFCAQRCQYCYYLSYAGKTPDDMEQFVDAVLEELRLYAHLPRFTGRPLQFVYFGGGTPSLLPVPLLRRLFQGLQAHFSWQTAEEITFECAPHSTTVDLVHLLREAGVNRLSLGVQQLDDEVLQRNGRIHLVADVERAYQEIQRLGFDEVNLDLMVGLVGETDNSFQRSLERTLELAPGSVTLYQCEAPHNTPLYRRIRDNSVVDSWPSWSTKRTRLAWAFRRLEADGYHLRSAYAAARNANHPRFVYQEEQYQGADLLGLGEASFSYIDGFHFQNQVSLSTYLEAIRQGELPLARAYPLAPREQAVRELILQLKLGQIDLMCFRQKHGAAVLDQLRPQLTTLIRHGWLVMTADKLALTREGLVRVDRFLPGLYLPEHQGLRYS